MQKAGPARVYSNGLPPIGEFYRGLKHAAATRTSAIPQHWEGFRSSLRPMLTDRLAHAQVTYENGRLTGFPEILGRTPSEAFEQRRDFETALWQLVSSFNIVDCAERRPESDPIKLIQVQKDGPVVRVRRGKDSTAPQITITSEGDPHIGDHLDVSLLRVTANGWHAIEDWDKSSEDVRAIASTTELLGAAPGFFLFDDPSLCREYGLDRFGFFWSTHPVDRLSQLAEWFRSGEVPEAVRKENFWREFTQCPNAANFLLFQNPVLVAVGSLG